MRVQHFEALKLLLEYRLTAGGVDNTNPYLFGLPGTLKGDHRYIRASECMTKFAGECEAIAPATLRATKLRKHLATMCSTLHLSEEETNHLATYMGHSSAVHREVYRQPIIVREILTLSKLLEDRHVFVRKKI